MKIRNAFIGLFMALMLCMSALPAFAVESSSSIVLEYNFGVLTYISTTSSNFCDFVSATGCTIYTAEYKYREKTARIVAGVEVHTTALTNQQAIDGIMGEFGREGYTSQKETYDGNNIYLFTGGLYPNQQMLAAWYSGNKIIALYVDNSPAVLTDAEVDDVFEDSLVKYYLAKYPSSLSFTTEPQSSCTDSDNGKNYNTKGLVTTSDESMWDYCQDSRTLIELTCDEAGGKAYTYTCPGTCSNGACVSAPNVVDKDTVQKISAISGNKAVYAPGEKISLKIKGIEVDDGSPAERDEGWNVQYYTYNVNNPDTYLQEYVPTGNYNGDYQDPYWYANYWAPEKEGKYYTEIVLYCSRQDSDCWEKIGSHNPEDEVRQKIYFTVDEDAVPEEEETQTGMPDLVIKNVKYLKQSDDLATIEFDIYNIGDAPAEDWFAIAVYVDGRLQTHTIYGEQKSGTSYPSDKDAVIPLMPGEVHHKSISNYYWLASGNLKRTVTLAVDRFEGSEEDNPVYEGFRDNMIKESNENNNKAELVVNANYNQPEEYSETTFWINDWRKTEKVVDGREHAFAVSDVDVESQRCAVYVDGETGWVNQWDTKTINGVKLRLEEASIESSSEIGRYEIRQCRIRVFGTTEEEIEIPEESVVVPEQGITVIKPDGTCPGCVAGDKCISIGIRFLKDSTPSYCDLSGSILSQKDDDKACQNDYECLSNTCGNGKCQNFSERLESLEKEMQETKGILNRILSWFGRLFGGE